MGTGGWGWGESWVEPMEGSLNPSQGRGQGDCPREAGPPEPPRDPAHGSALQLRGRAGPASQRPAPRVWNTRLLVLPLGFCWSPHHITPATTMMSPSFPRQENLPVRKRHPAFGAKGRVSRPYLSLWLSVPCRAGLPQAQVPGCPGAAPPPPPRSLAWSCLGSRPELCVHGGWGGTWPPPAPLPEPSSSRAPPPPPGKQTDGPPAPGGPPLGEGVRASCLPHSSVLPASRSGRACGPRAVPRAPLPPSAFSSVYPPAPTAQPTLPSGPEKPGLVTSQGENLTALG